MNASVCVCVSIRARGHLGVCVFRSREDGNVQSITLLWATMTMIRPINSVHKALTCPESQRARALAPSLFGEMLASCKREFV